MERRGSAASRPRPVGPMDNVSRRHVSHVVKDYDVGMAGGEEISSHHHGPTRPLAIGDSISLRDSSNQTHGDLFMYASQKLRSRAFVQSPDTVNPTDNFHKSVFEVS